MTLRLIASVFTAWLIGGLIVAVLWPRDRRVRTDLALILPLGAIIGLGLTSVLFFTATLIFPQPARWSGAVELVIALALMGCVWRRRAAISPEPLEAVAGGSWPRWLVASFFLQAIVVASIIAWRTHAAEPHGGWDGWAIWNLHARFMLRAGTDWPAALVAPELSWTHADYPWLVPASVARIWAWMGGESPLAGGCVSLLFAAATTALLVGAIASIRGSIAAFITGLLLLGTPFFATFASNQHADIPLASFTLAAVVLVVACGSSAPGRGMWSLAAISTGLAAWTKNEGLLFAVVFAAIVCVHAWRRRSRRDLLVFLGVLALALLPVGGFKLLLAPANDLMSAPFGPRIAHAWEFARHQFILSAGWRDLRGFGEWQVAPYLVMAVTFVPWRWRRPLAPVDRIVPVVLLAMLAGFYGVYLITPQDLTWHLDTSLVRLLLQLWPLALLWWGLSFSCWGPGPMVRGSWSRGCLGCAFVNALAAGAIAVALAGQPATNELAVHRVGFNTVSAIPGDGWFTIERHERDTWVWSRGNATLLVHVSANRGATPTTLRFSLRSLEPRTVIVRWRERVLWQGTVGKNFVAVEIPMLALPSGTSALELTTDSPGVASAPDARALAFALYNLRLE